jgi:hypothetical protein
VRKSLLKPLTVAEMKETGGLKITKIGVKRRQKVAHLLASAHKTGRSTVESVTAHLKREFGTKRNWERVAITELTEAKGIASLDVIQRVFGSDARVFRLHGPSCCEKCRSLFGSTKNPKIWRASQIPAKIRGAVHPNCVCGPWQCVDKPDLTKAADPMSDLPMGLVRKEYDPHIKHPVAIISTGNGYWTRMDSPTGRAIVQTIAMLVPAAKLRESLGFTVFVHGPIKTRHNKVELYDLRRLSGARFYPMDLGTDDDQTLRVKGMSQAKDLNEYLTHLKTVMPHIATMPEYWENGQSIRWLPDFFGFKTLTDWLIVVPGKVDEKNKIKNVILSLHGQKKAIRRTTYEQLEGAELRKCSY